MLEWGFKVVSGVFGGGVGVCWEVGVCWRVWLGLR